MKILFFGSSSQIDRSISNKFKFEIYGLSKKKFKHNYTELYKVNNYTNKEIKKVLKKNKIQFDHIFFFNGTFLVFHEKKEIQLKPK